MIIIGYIDELLPILDPIIAGIAKQFGPNCEFVIHDYSKSFETSIVSIVNGEVTGRTVGQGGTDIGLKIFNGVVNEDGKFNYISQTEDGRLLKSTTVYLRDDNGKVVGSLCMNYDISSLVQAKNVIDSFLGGEPDNSEQVETVVYANVEDMLISMVKESLQMLKTPVSLMTREQKVEGIKYLYEKGAFRIKKASEIVAKYYDISKFTVYNYINEIDENKGGG